LVIAHQDPLRWQAPPEQPIGFFAVPLRAKTLRICKDTRIAVAVFCVLIALVGTVSASGAGRPLNTAIEQPDASLTELRDSYKRIKAAGADYVRIILYWDRVQPTATGSNWTEPDKQIKEALTAGLTPFVTVWRAPRWAERSSSGETGTRDPDPAAFGRFAKQLAQRYPRVHHWEAWNEPNLDHFLSPQTKNGHRYSPDLYRQLLNEFWQGVHSVDPGAKVAGGGLARRYKIAPLQFMRDVFCLNDRLKRAASCPVHVDAWSHHPYTNGGPFTKQGDPDGVSMGDLPRMHRVLRAAARSGNVLPHKRSLPLWVSEFSWDTNRPDPDAVPMKRHARWVSEALYQAWRSGVTLFVWHQLRDRPFPSTQYQSGLYFCGVPSTSDDADNRCAQSGYYVHDKPKTGSVISFRFPFVAYAKHGRVKVWGRTADGRSHQVVIERKRRNGWSRVKTLGADRHGIFKAKWHSSDRKHTYRARVPRGAHSNGFSLNKPRRMSLPNTWGCGGTISCR
jgi:polysaccharide biosynthesis protein PslG